MKFDICTSYLEKTLRGLVMLASYLEEVLGRRACPEALAVATYAVYSMWYGPWGAVSLVCLCGLCVSGARLLESAVMQELMRRRGQPSAVGGGTAQKHAYYTALALLVLLLVQVLVSPATPWLLASRWYMLLVTPLLLGAELHLIGSPRAELNEALAETQTNYAQGAAWGFFLGYLMIIFGDGQATMGENDVSSFEKRMTDYLTSNGVGEEDRRRTCKDRMIILVPMKHEALLSDKDISVSDKSITRENKLRGIKSSGRKYGETQVYTIQHDGRSYRVAMEEATPIRTAALAVDASDVDFDQEDFEGFAPRFLTTLQRILRSKPGIGDQVELVPIEDMKKVGSTVVERILELEELKEEGSADQRQELAGRLTAAGSVAAGQPEQWGVST